MISSDGLIESTIIPKKETYYLVTGDTLDSMKSKNVLTDIFMFISSLMWGAYLSVNVTLKISINPTDQEKIILTTLDEVFFWTAILFTILGGIFLVWGLAYISKIKANKISLTPEQ